MLILRRGAIRKAVVPVVLGMLHDIIVYYAPREEKTWTVHSSCELTPEPKAMDEDD